MIPSRFVSACLALAPLLHTARADVTLFVPGFDPQPLSASEVGTDASSHTTWQIVPGVVTDTNQDIGLVGTATLIEGPSDARLLYENDQLSLTIDITCNIGDGLATCTGEKGYDTTPMPLGTAQPFVLQGNAAAPTGTTGSSSAAVAASATPGSSGASLPSNTGSSSATAPIASKTPVSTSGSVQITGTASWFGVVAVGILFTSVL